MDTGLAWPGLPWPGSRANSYSKSPHLQGKCHLSSPRPELGCEPGPCCSALWLLKCVSALRTSVS